MMRAASAVILLLAAVVAFPASARRHRKKKQAVRKEALAPVKKPVAVPDEEPWPEEIPDYAEPSFSEPPVAQPSFTEPVAALSVEEQVELLMKQSIMGESVIDAGALRDFVARHNPEFDIAIAEAYITVGRRYGIRGDIALCQSILETGWFRFADGTCVTPDQHNYCGLGVVKLGSKGHSFDTIEQGVTAQMQHLYAYACSDPLPEGEKLLDPRFKLVSRGVAPTWAELSGRWAANDRYARSFLRLYIELTKFCAGKNKAGNNS